MKYVIIFLFLLVGCGTKSVTVAAPETSERVVLEAAEIEFKAAEPNLIEPSEVLDGPPVGYIAREDLYGWYGNRFDGTCYTVLILESPQQYTFAIGCIVSDESVVATVVVGSYTFENNMMVFIPRASTCPGEETGDPIRVTLTDDILGMYDEGGEEIRSLNKFEDQESFEVEYGAFMNNRAHHGCFEDEEFVEHKLEAVQ